MNTFHANRLFSSSSALVASAALLALAPLLGGGGEVQIPHTFQPGTKARASEVNANFDAVADAIESLPSPANRIVVDSESGDFASVAAALASINDAAVDNPYVVWVAPGVYIETQTSVVPAFVSLVGASAASTTITSSLSSNASNETSATVQLEDLGSLRDLTIENTGASAISTAVYGAGLSRETRISDCVLRAIGAGGSGHFAAKFDDSDLTMVDCVMKAEGASTGNTAFGSSDISGAFAQPRLVDCVFEAKVVSNGIGLQLTKTAARVEGCAVEGWFRAISSSISGLTTVRDSEIKTLGLTPVYEQSGSASIFSGTTFFIGGNPIGLASQFKYAWCIKPNFDPVVNGFGSSVQ